MFRIIIKIASAPKHVILLVGSRNNPIAVFIVTIKVTCNINS